MNFWLCRHDDPVQSLLSTDECKREKDKLFFIYMSGPAVSTFTKYYNGFPLYNTKTQSFAAFQKEQDINLMIYGY